MKVVGDKFYLLIIVIHVSECTPVRSAIIDDISSVTLAGKVEKSFYRGPTVLELLEFI